MKTYLKPQMELNQFNLNENVASINDWVTGEGSNYSSAGITTYYVQS